MNWLTKIRQVVAAVRAGTPWVAVKLILALLPDLIPVLPDDGPVPVGSVQVTTADDCCKELEEAAAQMDAGVQGLGDGKLLKLLLKLISLLGF